MTMILSAMALLASLQDKDWGARAWGGAVELLKKGQDY